MAVVKIVSAYGGLKVPILDDLYASATPEELARRRKELARVVSDIAHTYARNHPEYRCPVEQPRVTTI